MFLLRRGVSQMRADSLWRSRAMRLCRITRRRPPCRRSAAAADHTGSKLSSYILLILTATLSLLLLSSGLARYAISVADKITISGGTATTVNDNYASLSGGSPIKSDALCE